MPSSVPCSIKSLTSSSVTISEVSEFIPKIIITPSVIFESKITGGLKIFTIRLKVLKCSNKTFSGDCCAARMGRNSPSTVIKKITIPIEIAAETICACSKKFICSKIIFESGIAQNPAKISATVAPAFEIKSGIAGDSSIESAACTLELPPSASFSIRPCKLSDNAVSISEK